MGFPPGVLFYHRSNKDLTLDRLAMELQSGKELSIFHEKIILNLCFDYDGCVGYCRQ